MPGQGDRRSELREENLPLSAHGIRTLQTTTTPIIQPTTVASGLISVCHSKRPEPHRTPVEIPEDGSSHRLPIQSD